MQKDNEKWKTDVEALGEQLIAEQKEIKIEKKVIKQMDRILNIRWGCKY